MIKVYCETFFRYILRCLWEIILIIMGISEGVTRLGLGVHRMW